MRSGPEFPPASSFGGGYGQVDFRLQITDYRFQIPDSRYQIGYL
jgi:hypothetical protein